MGRRKEKSVHETHILEEGLKKTFLKKLGDADLGMQYDHDVGKYRRRNKKYWLADRKPKTNLLVLFRLLADLRRHGWHRVPWGIGL